MNNLSAVEVIETGEDLTSEIGQGGFVRDVCAFKGSTVHVLEEDLNLAGVIEHVVTLDDVEVIDVTKNLDFSTDLTTNFVFMVSVDNFESEVAAGGAMEDFVNGSTAAASDSIDTVELGEVDGLLLSRGV